MEIPESDQYNLETRTQIPLRRLLQAGVVIFLLIVGATVFFMTPPGSFPSNAAITIEPGLSAAAIAQHMETERVVRSNVLLYGILVFLHDPSSIQAGTYVFSTPISVFGVADRIANDSPEIETITLTFPEGYSNGDYASIASGALIDFDAEQFLMLSSTSEGFLFPDTYFVPPDFSAQELYTLLRTAYDDKTESLRPRLESNKLTEEEILTLASILEREANSEETMRIVAGILDSRLVLRMPLQADATMEYVLEKPLAELTPEDLEIDSPYNTYLYQGLPPTPIGNPGLVAIEAVLEPNTTDYLYYLTDENGDFFYAETFEEHKANIARYLR